MCVIVPSVGNQVELGITLDGLLAQSYYGPCEIVVVGPGADPGREQAESRAVRFIDDGLFDIESSGRTRQTWAQYTSRSRRSHHTTRVARHGVCLAPVGCQGRVEWGQTNASNPGL